MIVPIQFQVSSNMIARILLQKSRIKEVQKSILLIPRQIESEIAMQDIALGLQSAMPSMNKVHRLVIALAIAKRIGA